MKPRTSRTPNPSDFKAAFAAVHITIQNRMGGISIAKLIVAEKPSVAMSYAKVLGATNRQDGYLEGNGYLVSWCVGHLVELAPPNVYDEKYTKWSIADLPILPQKWQYLVSASTKKQFGILKKLMHRPDVDSIVNSCDEGREVTLFRLYPGELCVLSASCVISQITFDTQMTAGMDTDVLIIPANVIAALKEKNLHVRCFLYELATKRFSDVMWAMQQIMFKGLDQRLAEFLFAEAERTGSDTIRMTHEQIAQHISSAREAVARMLKSFSEDGLVELKRGAITLRDKNRLNRLK